MLKNTNLNKKAFSTVSATNQSQNFGRNNSLPQNQYTKQVSNIGIANKKQAELFVYEEEFMGLQIDNQDTFYSKKPEEQQEQKKQTVVGEFMEKAIKNPKIYRIITQEARKRGYLNESIDGSIPKHKQQFAYYDKKIRPYQSIETPLERYDTLNNRSSNYIEESKLKDYIKNQKINWYMQRFNQLEEEENVKRQTMIKQQETKRKYYLSQIHKQNKEKQKVKQQLLNPDINTAESNFEETQLQNSESLISPNEEQDNYDAISQTLAQLQNQQQIIQRNTKTSNTIVQNQNKNFFQSHINFKKISRIDIELIKKRQLGSQASINNQSLDSMNSYSISELSFIRQKDDKKKDQELERKQRLRQKQIKKNELLKYGSGYQNVYNNENKTSETLKSIYKSFQNPHTKQFDRKIFKTMMISEYSEFGRMLYKRMKKFGSRVFQSHEFNIYCEVIEKVMNNPIEFYLKTFFGLLDINQDGKICDQDLFQAFQLMQNEKLLSLFNDDIQLVIKAFSQKRLQNGKQDSVRLSVNIIKYHGNLAREYKRPFDKQDRVEKAKQFFKLVMDRRDKQVQQEQNPYDDEIDSDEEQMKFNDALNKHFSGDSMDNIIHDSDRIYEEYKLACKLSQKVINKEVFMSYLMDKLDQQREHFTFEEFQEIDFQIYGIPKFIVDYVSRMSGQPFEVLIYQRLKRLKGKRFGRRAAVIQIQEPLHKQDGFIEEEREILVLKIRLKHLDFEKFELVFRQLCKDPSTPFDFDLRMNQKSLTKGLKSIYGFQGNEQLSNMIFNYFSKGLTNYEVKFSQFMYHFIAELDLDRTRQNHLVFKMLDEDKDNQLSILDLLRAYVNLPKYCKFNEEFRKILRYYLENSVKPPVKFRREIDYNFHLFKQLVPLSCLAFEFRQNFVEKVMRMLTNDKNIDEMDEYLVFKYQVEEDSVFFDMRSKRGESLEDTLDDSEIRKYFKLFGERVSKENIEEVCRAFINQ
eukprot:403367910